MSVAVSQAPNIPQTSSSSSLCASNSASGSSSRPLSLAPPPASHSRAPSPSHHGSSPLSARKIRFAPLPDPRRAVLVTENGEEVPIPNGEEATQISLSPAMAAFDSTTVLDNSSLSSFGSSKRNSDTDPSTTPGTTTPASTPSEYGNSRPGSPSASPISLPPPLPNVQSIPTAQRPKSKGLSFLKSLKRSSASSSSSNTTLTPTPSIERQTHGAGGARDRKSITTEEILTLGTINLFRTSSRESTKSTESGSGWNLTRWTSSTSGQPPVKQWGAPLSRSQSSQSHRSKTPSLLSGLRPSSSSGGRSKKQAPVRKGTRMLNGRVYGGRGLNPNSNLFANAPDVEPEFVEWGHGGMGSVQGVKSAGANSKWQRLGASNDEELDDGGGMAWVKKRKEERERKEREEKEKAEREAATVDAAAAAAAPEAKPDEETNVDVVPISPPASESAMPTPRASTPSVAPNPHARVSSASINTHHSASTAVPATPVITPSTPADLTTPTGHHGGDDDHVFKTMAVPMQPRHRRARSRDGLSPPGSPDEIKNSYFDVHVLDKRSSSGSSSETDSTSSEDEEDDDDDEEDEEELERRKAMVIGAGMEKISRHREHEETPQSS